MEASIKEVLRRLCVEIGWSYAVFWKRIGSGDQTMHLVWEDGNCEQIRETEVLRSLENGGFSLLGSKVEDEVRAGVFELMANEVHVIGDGIVGKAAWTGKHEWVHGDVFNLNGSISKGLVEINNQTLAGMKTIAIIPVLPHGVVQLGSNQIVMENIEFINHVKGLFEQLLLVPSTLLSDTNHKILGQKIQQHESAGRQIFVQFGEDGTTTNISSSLVGNSNSQYFPHQDFSGPHASSLLPDNMPAHVPEVPLSLVNMSSAPTPPCSLSIQTVMFSDPDIRLIENVLPCDQNCRSQLESPIALSYNIISSFGKSQILSRVDDHEAFNLSPKDAGNVNSQCADSSLETPQVRSLTEHSNLRKMISGNLEPSCFTSFDKNSLTEFTEQPKIETNIDGLFQELEVQSLFDDHGSCYTSLLGYLPDGSDQENTMHQDSAGLQSHRFTIPSENDEVGNEKLEFRESLNKRISNSLPSLSSNDQYKSGFSNGRSDDVIIDHTGTVAHELGTVVSTYNVLNDEIYCNGIFSEVASDQLLDSVVSHTNLDGKYHLDENALSKIPSTKLCSSSLHMSSITNNSVNSPKQMHIETLALPPILVKSKPAASSSVKSEGCFSKRNEGYKTQINLWIENSQKINCETNSVAHEKKVGGVGILNKKRSRPGESPRPRPKDRQMIQDHIKELREIVPNGAKYSIDALLEKTIKHMLFLQSVTKYADKIKETWEPQIINTEEGLLLKDNFEGGATWAFEVGSQSVICPIVVEDLNPPRQMLVEMLCEERGLFLEIADVVRGMGLTILKGVMEARNSKVWARFAVETNRDVTRSELFFSLIRLFELSVGGNKALESILNKPHNMFPPSSSIPATGLSDRFC